MLGFENDGSRGRGPSQRTAVVRVLGPAPAGAFTALSLFHDAFEIGEIVPCHFGERCRFDTRSQPHRNLGRPIGERLEQNDATRKIVRHCLPCNSSLRNTEHDLHNGPIFFAVQQRSEREMCFVDFLHISQRSDESRKFFEARAVGVNVRHRSVQHDRIDLGVRIERCGLSLF